MDISNKNFHKKLIFIDILHIYSLYVTLNYINFIYYLCILIIYNSFSVLRKIFFLGCHFLFEVQTKYHSSSCTQIYCQTGLQSTESNMLLELLAQILSEPCFTTLRTKEQLGYIVFSGVRRTNGAQGLRIIVQSDRHPKYVEQRIHIFLNSMLVSN